jgi:hypothetical protein
VALLPLAGIAQCPHDRVGDLRPARGNYQTPLALVERVTGDWLYAQSSAIGVYLDFARPEPEMVAQLLWYNQSACLINGCSHAWTLPLDSRQLAGASWAIWPRPLLQ